MPTRALRYTANMRRLLPTLSTEVEIEDVYRDLEFPEAPAGRPYVYLNFVSTVDGQVTLGGGGAAGIGSKVDHRLMGRLRVTADALLHGASTVRKDNFPPQVPADLEEERIARGLTRQPFGAVITRSGDITPDNRYFSRPGSVILTTSRQVARLTSLFGDRAIVIGCGEDTVDLASALGALRERFGVRTLLCEGGPGLTHDLVAGGHLDEIFLTLAPKLGSDKGALRLLEGPTFDPAALPQLELLQVLAEGSELFLRYRLPPTPVALAR